MDINFKCPHCKQELVVDGTGAGERVPCPTCNREILVPLDCIEREKVSDTAQDNHSPAVMAAERQRIDLDKVRNSARLAVEDHWRQFLTLAHSDMRKAVGTVHSFKAMVKEMTAHMPEPDASVFRQTVEAERQKLADEYDRNPGALRARLGLATPLPAFMPSRNRQGMDELVVRTADRATIWESIWAIFRLFR